MHDAISLAIMDHILSIVLFTPLVGMLVLLFIPSSNARAVKIWANIAGFLGFLVSLPLAVHFDRTKDYQYVEQANWIPSIGASYHLGIDGLSLLLVMLTTLLGFLAILSSWNAITERLKEYYAFFLLLQTGMLGVFMALDFLLFFVFWETVLVPMYFIIAIWGGPRRGYASIKFMIYTLIGSVLMLLGILMLYFQYYTQFQAYSFDIADLMKINLPAVGWWVFWAFFLGFAVKVPMCPFHTWLPDAHVGSAHGGLRHSGQRAAEDGHVRLSALLAAAAARHRQEPDGDQHRRGAFDYRHRLRRAGVADAEGLEEAGGVLVGEPPGLLHAGHFYAESDRHLGLDHPADQSRHLDRHALPDRRRRL